MRLTPLPPGRRPRLSGREAHPPHGLPPQLDEATDKVLKELNDLQEALYAERKRALLIICQGRDAAGKDATIRHVCHAFDPQGISVTPFRIPTATEAAHDYLWRVHAAVPPRGTVGVFNRSHYEDILVPRVHREISRSVVQSRIRQINDFERMLVENGVMIVKFFLHVSRKEQRKRFAERLDDPRKNWKIAMSDLADRKLWDAYTRAYRDALAKCSTPWAPWYIVPADSKRERNYMVADVLRATLRLMHPRFPRADPAVLAKARKLL